MLTLDEASACLVALSLLLGVISSVLFLYRGIRYHDVPVDESSSRGKGFGRVMELVAGVGLCFGIAYVGFGVVPFWPFWIFAVCLGLDQLVMGWRDLRRKPARK
ncbi:MAG: hypothetical protein WCD79_07390 [Chthoniobacteraceae bacterium]